MCEAPVWTYLTAWSRLKERAPAIPASVPASASAPTASTAMDTGDGKSESNVGKVGEGLVSKLEALSVSVVRRPPDSLDAKHAAQPASGSLGAAGRTRSTSRYGTKYERTKLIGEYAHLLSLGAEPPVNLLSLPEHERANFANPNHIAEHALLHKTLPLGIRRHLSDGSHEDWFLQPDQDGHALVFA
jgi:hypothetical protein